MCGLLRDALALVGCVSIVPDDEALGWVLYNDGPYWFDEDDDLCWFDEEPPPTAEYVEALVVELYAGFAARVRFDPSCEEKARLGAASDTEKAERCLGLLPGDPAENERRLRARAAEWVGEHWAAIERLARELLEHRTLSAEEIDVILDDNLTPEDLARVRLICGNRLQRLPGRR